MILGISDGIHNSAACLLRNGTVVAAVEEERISRYKRDGRPPTGAVNSILDDYDLDDVTRVAVSGTVNWSVSRRLKSVFRGISDSSANLTSEPELESYHGNDSVFDRFATLGIGFLETVQQPEEFLSKVADYLRTDTPIGSWSGSLVDRMEYVDHHRAHAAGAFFTSGFSEATVLTVDSAGDNLSSSVYHGKDDTISRVAANSAVDSLGRIWSRLPTVFGFKGARHAGKFMGLAAYASDPPSELREQFRNMITVEGLEITNR